MRNLTLISCLLWSSAACTQGPGSLKAALGDVRVTEDWIYDDIEAGYLEAKRSGKPLLVAFR
jgi:hypothetical protein